LQALLDGAVRDVLERIRRDDPRLVEVLLTDREGDLLAATEKTYDFSQSDEAWWQRTYNDGNGRVVIPPVNYDRSAGVWAVDICVPVMLDGEVVGAAKAVLDVGRLLPSGQRDVGEYPASVMLLDEGSERVIFRPGVVPFSKVVQDVIGLEQAGGAGRWGRTDRGFLHAAATVDIGGRIGPLEILSPRWRLMLFMPSSTALGPVNRLSWITASVALLIVGAIFMVGLGLLERSIVRRLQRLAEATHRVAGGDLHHRIPASRLGRALLGRDEIDELGEDFNRMVRQIQRSHDQLQSASELKSRFIKIASHELRTPVSYILGMASLLKNADDPKKLRKGLVAMGRRAARLNEIISTMFKLMPGEGEAEALEYRRLDVTALLERVYRDCVPFAEQRNQRLLVEIAENLPSVTADEGLMLDVLENLVMNAIKFTPDDGVIKIRVGRQLGQRVSFAVQDQGPGIPEADLPHIFDAFYSGGEIYQHSTGESGYQKRGMGLGLAIVKHFVQLHGGSVNVQSTSMGSLFTVTIPCEPPQPYPGRAPSSERPQPRPVSPGGSSADSDGGSSVDAGPSPEAREDRTGEGETASTPPAGGGAAE
jgi:signal transduction histidine kinase